jgi:hypothetical protein
MGTDERRAARESFSERLGEVLDAVTDVPRTRGRRTWVAKQWNVSVETARKWLVGLDIPDRAHLAAICAKLGVSPDWMLTGRGQRYLTEPDELLDRFLATWARLSEQNREEIVALATFMAQRGPPLAPSGQTEIAPLSLRR